MYLRIKVNTMKIRLNTIINILHGTCFALCTDLRIKFVNIIT